MSDQGKIRGGCLCESVRYTVRGEPLVVADCYCTDCRKASGTSHCTHAAFQEAAFSVGGELRFFDKPVDSGNTVSRGFCPQCGSAIYSTNSSMPGMVFVRASSLDDPGCVAPGMTVYASRAPGWARIDDSQPVFAEMPPNGAESVMKSN